MSDMEQKMVTAFGQIGVLEQEMAKMKETISAINIDKNDSNVMQEQGDASKSSDTPQSKVMQEQGDALKSSDTPQSKVMQEQGDAIPPGGGRRRRSRRGKRPRKSRKSRKSRRSRRH